MRYVVTELEGFNEFSRGSSLHPGLSCHVIDTAWNYRLVATYRTEDYGRGGRHWSKRLKVRERAAQHAERLNADA